MEECDEALQKLKEALVSPPIMAYPLDSGKYILDCDSSDYALGGFKSDARGCRKSDSIWE